MIVHKRRSVTPSRASASIHYGTDQRRTPATIHTQVCKAALHAFAAENEARIAATTTSGEQIASEVDRFEATLRHVGHEAITVEIIELSAGASNLSVTR